LIKQDIYNPVAYKSWAVYSAFSITSDFRFSFPIYCLMFAADMCKMASQVVLKNFLIMSLAQNFEFLWECDLELLGLQWTNGQMEMRRCSWTNSKGVPYITRGEKFK